MKTIHRALSTLPKCDVCGTPATHGAVDCREIPTTDPDGWREFEQLPERRGCSQHPVVAMTFYMYGRIKPSAECVPEQCGKPSVIEVRYDTAD